MKERKEERLLFINRNASPLDIVMKLNNEQCGCPIENGNRFEVENENSEKREKNCKNFNWQIKENYRLSYTLLEFSSRETNTQSLY